jgi:hypothetical protein
MKKAKIEEMNEKRIEECQSQGQEKKETLIYDARQISHD